MALMMAAVERVMSSSVVDQFETDSRMAGWPSQVVAPTQQVPSCWTCSMTASVSTAWRRKRTWLRTAV